MRLSWESVATTDEDGGSGGRNEVEKGVIKPATDEERGENLRNRGNEKEGRARHRTVADTLI